jgi:hypothetical protein
MSAPTVERKRHKTLGKALARTIVDPGRNLSAVQIGEYLNLLTPTFFVEALHHAPKLWAAVEQRIADQKLATSTFTQTRLLKGSLGR